ncbi:MAG: hypothetical protein QM726_01025 [Chitinophagaceae bacterium]
MRTKERGETRQAATNKDFKTSAYDNNRQIKDRKVIIHVDTNRTKVDGKLCHGAKSAQDAINQL